MFFLPVELLSPSHLVLLSALAAVVASDNVAGRSPLTLEDRVTILERRVDSLEAPSKSNGLEIRKRKKSKYLIVRFLK